VYLVLPMVLALGALALFAGCRKDQPTAGTQGPMPMKHAATPAAQPMAQTAEQTNCPIMGGSINKDIFVEYQGKKVYFCCSGCPDTFQANPEKYLSQLPQFQGPQSGGHVH
jgi:YHS domain-containing protein